MTASLLLLLSSLAQVQPGPDRTILYQDVTGHGDFRCTRLYLVPPAAALTVYRGLVPKDGLGGCTT